MKAMKYTEVPESRYEDYVKNPEYWFQQKMDGTRVLITWSPGNPIQFFQRDGKPLKYAAAAQHVESLRTNVQELFVLAATHVYEHPLGHLRKRLTFDGELVIHEGRQPALYLWDVLDSAKPGAEYWSRFQTLSRIFNYARSQPVLEKNNVHLSTTIRGEDEKRQFLKQAQSAGVEGVMAKWQREVYRPGERSTTTVKLKFVKEADVVVTSWERGTTPEGRATGSAEFGVHGFGGQMLSVGRCSLIGKPEVEVGSVITVKYLYWTGSAVVQPRMVRVRQDKVGYECTVYQFSEYSKEAL